MNNLKDIAKGGWRPGGSGTTSSGGTMNNLKDLAKGGWHPGGKGSSSSGAKSKESWRGDFKGIDTVVSLHCTRSETKPIWIHRCILS